MRYYIFRWSLFGCIIVTAFMGLSDSLIVWYFLRFGAGLFSGLLMVLGSSLVMSWLSQNNAIKYTGILHSGVGVGIAMTGISIPVLHTTGGLTFIWIGLGLLSLLPLFISWIFVPNTQPSITVKKSSLNNGTKTYNFKLIRLYIAYFLEGLGYIVTATFLVSILSRQFDSFLVANNAWILVGVAAAITTVLWPFIAARIGIRNSIIIAHFVQSVAILCPIIFPNQLGAILGAIGFGGTFLGIVALSLSYGQRLMPDNANRVIGTLTVLFGSGQIIGPYLAGAIMDRTGSYSIPLIGASAVVFTGALVLLTIKND